MDEKEFNYINAIPLIDVMLVLLTITLTTATFMTFGAIKVNLPQTASVAVQEPDTISVTLTKDHKIFVDSAEINANSLEAALAKYDNTKSVVISADKTLTIDELTNALGHIQNAGFTKMSIKTEIPQL
ncbi:hypothetical protein FACS189487_02590 [Campylobacterota bacterium]|nr:hypothetical protein FACS189487_02590 [Campylobacterota bacterium]